MTAQRRALVLGGSGFLGTHLIAALSAGSYETVNLARAAPYAGSPAEGARLVLSPVGIEIVRHVINESAPDIVFHLAGSSFVPPSVDDPHGDLDRNAGTLLHTLEAVRRSECSPRVVYVSSAAVYGHGIRMPMAEDHPLEPVSPYGVAKLASEQYCAQYVRLHGLRTLSARPFSLYGPWQRKLVVHDLALRVLAGENPLVIAAPPDVVRDFVFARDAAHALIRLGETAPAEGEAYNLASGVGTSLADLSSAITGALDLPVEVRFTGTLRAGDPRRWIGSTSRAAALGAICDTPLADGVAATVEWLRQP